jgi:hypothetical protein
MSQKYTKALKTLLIPGFGGSSLQSIGCSVYNVGCAQRIETLALCMVQSR